MSTVYLKKWRSVRNSSFNRLERLCKVNWTNWRIWPVSGSFYVPRLFSPERRFMIFQQCELKIFSSKICSLKGVFLCKFWVWMELFCVWKKINLNKWMKTWSLDGDESRFTLRWSWLFKVVFQLDQWEKRRNRKFNCVRFRQFLLFRCSSHWRREKFV